MIPDVLKARGVSKLAAAAGFTGAAPQTVNGNAVVMDNVATGTLCARIKTRATTNTITLTGKWQVFTKAGVWVDVINGTQNAAGVAFQTGTGSGVNVERVFPAPEPVYAFAQARFVVTTGAAVGAGAGSDEVTELDYYHQRPWF